MCVLCFQIVSNTQTSTTATSSSRVQKSTITSSSSQRVNISSSDLKASSMKNDLDELKSSISEMKNLSTSQAFSRLRSSMDNLVEGDSDMVEHGEPLVTFPDGETPPPVSGVMSSPSLVPRTVDSSSCDTVKFEHKATSSASSTKVVTDSYSAEKATANSTEMKRLQAGEVNYQEQSAVAGMRARLDMDGISAEKSQLLKQVSIRRSIRCPRYRREEFYYCRRVMFMRRIFYLRSFCGEMFKLAVGFKIV